MTYTAPKFSDGKDVNWDARVRNLSPLVTKLVPELKRFVDHASRKIITPFSQNAIVPYSRMVVPVSGGLDSCTSAWLCAQAIEEKPRHKDDFLTLLGFVGNGLNPEDQLALEAYRQKFEERFGGIPHKIIIKNIETLLEDVNQTTQGMLGNTERYINLTQCRVISMLTMNYADSHGSAGVDSTNKDEVILSEIALGTGYEVNPLGDLYKSVVYELARQIGVPNHVLKRDAQNSSLGNSKVNSYFERLPEGFTSEDAFQILDPVLYCYENNWSQERTAESLEHGIHFVRNVFEYCEKQRRNLRRDNPYYLKIESEKHSSKIPLSKSVLEQDYAEAFVGK